MKRYLFTILLLPVSLLVKAQEQSTKNEPEAVIEDNSFFIEEAYNQEDRVVQHISNGYYRSAPSKDFYYTFTQEWPVGGYRHQLSYTIPYSFLDQNAVRGFGDIMINYRYQLFYKEKWACVAPRFSIILPTGNDKSGLGQGVFGCQFNLPVSKRLSDAFVVHLNAGTTILPKVKGMTAGSEEVKKTLTFYNLGGSLIWLATPGFNLMLECLDNFNSDINTSGIVHRSSEIILNPGVRGAINIGDLQIVPGLSVPFFISQDEISTGILFYLSFEHPF